jgi:hypothetical protein
MEWQPIETAPRDGAEFQAWLVNDDGCNIGWEPRARFKEGGCFQIWDRVDYDQDGWITEFWFQPTHWMPMPPPPTTHEETDQ